MSELNLRMIPWQMTLLKDTSPMRVAMLGRSSGKSHYIAASLLRDLSLGHTCMLAAPSHSQTLDVIEQLRALCGDSIPFKPKENHYRVANGKLYKASSQRPDLVRGKNLTRLFVDEASFVSEYFIKSVLQPAMRKKSEGGLQVTYCSTPLGTQNWLSKLVLEGKCLCVRGTYRDNKYIDPFFLNMLEEEYKDGNELIYRREILGEIVDFDVESMFASRIDHLIQGTATAGQTCTVGLDVAAGGDYTALVAVSGDAAIRVEKRKTPDLEDIKRFVREFIQGLPEITHFRYDSSGQAKTYQSALTSIVGRSVTPVNFGATQDSRYLNNRAKMYNEMLIRLGRNFMVPPKHYSEIRGDLMAHEFMDSELKAGKIAVVPKDKVKEKIGRSPDLGDALCLATMQTNDWKAAFQLAATI